jgi:hypothetical protein
MPTNRSMIEKSLVPGVHEMVGLSYGETPEEHKPLFEILNSQRSFEEEVYVSGMGGALLKPEGTAVQFDDIQETYNARWQHETVAIAFAVTKEAFDDDLYDTIARAKAQELGRSMADTKQVKAAAVFNNAFNPAFPGGDGVSLINAAHPTSIGSFSNDAGAAPLSEVALEDAHVAISKLTNDRGILLALRPSSLHLPPELQWTAEKILNSTLTTQVYESAAQSATNRNDLNALNSTGKYPGGVYLNHRFTSPTAWFIKTTANNGTKMFVRESLGGDTDTDFVTDNMLFKFRERYSFGWMDPRQWYGSNA